MKKSKYIKYLLFRQWLPFIILFTALPLLAFFSQCVSASLYYEVETRICISNMQMYYITIPIILYAIVMPFLAFSYRFTTKTTDTYYQFPFKPKELKNIRVTVGYLCVIAALVISYVIPMLVLLLRYSLDPGTATINGKLCEIAYFNFGYAFVYLLIEIATCSLLYFITCFFVSLSNNLISAIIINVVFHLVLIFVMNFLFLGIAHNIVHRFNPYDNIHYYEFEHASQVFRKFSPGIMITDSLGFEFYNVFVCGNDSWSMFNMFFKDSHVFGMITYIISIALSVILGIIACIFTYINDDRSGELCKKHGFANSKLNIVLLLIAVIPVILYCFVTDTPAFFSNLFLVIGLIAVIYVIYVLFVGTFKVHFSTYIVLAFAILLPIVVQSILGVIVK